MDGDVMISVDPHKASNTAVVLDPLTRVVVASQRFANSAAGYQRLREFSRRWDQRRWAVEGCHGAGRSLAQRLVADGELVLDVPAKLAARVRVYSQGHGRKTDTDDAVSIGLAALNSSGVAVVRRDDTLVSLRLLSDRRDELGALRTQAVCRFHRLLAELTPGGTHRGLKASRAQQLLDKLRPEDPVALVRLQLAHQHLADIRALDAKMKTIRELIEALLETTGSRLADLYGIGPIIAGRVLAEVETIDRFPSKDHFASYNGTAPIDASSGEQVRHRLSRAGNRRLNHALHMMAVTQIRNPGTPGRIYYERKRLEGKTLKEALRCLKRRLSDVVYRQLVAEQSCAKRSGATAGRIDPCGSPTITTPTRPTSTSAGTRPRRTAPQPRPAPPTASTGSSRSTGRAADSSASRSSTQATSSGKRSSTKQTPTDPAPIRTTDAVPRRRSTSPPAAGVKAGAATRRASALTPARTTTHSPRGNSSKINT
jgi:transposase